MKHLIDQLLNRIRFILGGDVLRKDFYKMMWVHVSFTVYTQMHGIFINTYLLKATGDNQQVMLFNLVLLLAQPFAMVLAVYAVRRLSPLISQRIGFGLFVCVYALLAVFGRQAVHFSLLLAVLLATAAGFYWVTYSLQIMSYTDDSHRDVAMGVIGILSGVAILVTPIFSGFLISAFNGFVGYQVLFICALITTLLSGYFSLRLAPVTAHDNQKSTFFREAFKSLVVNKVERGIMITNTISGFRDGTMSFFLNMLLYQAIQSEALVGINAFIGGAAGIIAAGVYGRILRPDRRAKSIFYGASIVIGAALVLFFKFNAATIIILNLVISAMNIFISNPPYIVYLNLLQKRPNLKGKGAEAHTIREFFLSLGRTLGIIVAMVVPQSNTGSIIVILFLTAVQYISSALVAHAQRQITLMPDET